MIELNIKQQLGTLRLDVSEELPAEGITAVFGVSGAGKTSLINAISGLTRPQEGRIVINGRVVVDCKTSVFLPPEKRRIGYVFQDARLFPHYRVKGNLQYGMDTSMKGQFEQIVSLLGIEQLLSRFPVTLSGGEKQRVAIGRALLTAPDLMLMDEPLASLDEPRKRELLPYLERLTREIKIPILYVSHSLDEILRLAQHIVILEQGKVLASGAIDKVWASTSLRPWLPENAQDSLLNVAFWKQHETYAMSALRLGDDVLWVKKLDMQPGETMRIKIKSSDVSLSLVQPEKSSIRNILPATVEELLEIEGQIDVQLRIAGDNTLWARITPWAADELGIHAGQQLYAQVKSVSIGKEMF